MPPSLFAAPANRVPLSAYAGRPHPSRPAGAGYGGQGSDLYAWARSVVEKVRVASVGGRLRFLPWFDPYTDETPDMGREYRTMLRESSVKAAFQTKILSVISEDIQFQPEDDNDPREQEGAAFCSYAFTHLKGGTRALGWSVLHPAVIDGHSVCEKVWDEHPLSRGRFKGKRIYHAVKAKDSHYLQLGIDPFRNVTALRGTGFNAGRVWSPSDFVIFSYFSLFENPAGMSDFRAAYRPYWIKDTSWKLRSLHLQQWTGPYLRGTYATQEQKAALEDAFNNAASSTWLTIPAGVLVEAVDLSMRGTSDFKDAIADCDREILIAIVGAHLQILEGQTGGARGNTKVHKEIGELIQWWLAATLADTYQAQLVVPLMAENYHDVEPPRVTVGAITDEDMLQRAKVYQALQQVGLKLSQKAVYRAVSIQPPDPNDPDDTLLPPGGGGGPKPPGPGGGGGEGQSPFAEQRPPTEFAEGDGLFHGPTPPGPGWVQVGVGPHGGKRWKKAKGGTKGAGKPEGKGLATGAAVPRSPRGGEPVGGKRPHKGLATGRAVPKAPRGEGNPEPEQSSPRGTTRAAGTAKDAGPDEPAERRPGRDRKASSTRGDTQATDAPRAAHKSRTAGLEERHAQATAAYEQAHAAWEEETARLEKGHEAAYAAWEARGEKRDRLGDLAGKDAAGLVEQLAPVEGTLGRMRAAVPKTDAAGPGGRLAARGEAAAYAAAALSTWDDAYGPGGQLARGLGEAGLSADDLAPVLAAAAKGRASLEKSGQRYLAATDRYLSARAKREEHEAKEPPDPFDLEEPDPDDDAFPDQASYDAAHAGWQQEYDSAVDKQGVWQEKMDTLSGREEELAQVMEELTDGLDDEWVEQDERVTKALDKVQQGVQRRVEKEEEADPEPEEPEPPPEPEEPDEPDWPEEPEEDDPRAHPHAEGR